MKKTKPIKIGIDCRMYSKKFTGIGRYINQLIFHLSKIDNTNQYYLFLNKDDFHELKSPSPNFHKILVNAPHYSFREQTTFLYHLYRQNLDLVHFTNFNHPLLYLKSQVTTIHDLTLNFYPGKKFQSPIYKLAYKLILWAATIKSKAIITISKNTQKDLQQFYPKSKNKTHIIYNGVDQTFLKNTQKSSLKLPSEYLLYTGNWRVHKNLINLVKGFKLLKEKHNYQGQLLLTGKPNPLYPETLNFIQSQKLQNDVQLLGLVEEEELPHLYKNATAYIFPSLYEGFGLPILEAYASKTPVCCSNTSCLPEIAGQGALFFNPNSPQDIAKTINTLLTSPQLQKDLINKSQKQLKKFSFATMAQKTHNLYISSTHK